MTGMPDVEALEAAYKRGKADHETAANMTMPAPYEDPAMVFAWRAGFDHAAVWELLKGQRSVNAESTEELRQLRIFLGALKYFNDRLGGEKNEQ